MGSHGYCWDYSLGMCAVVISWQMRAFSPFHLPGSLRLAFLSTQYAKGYFSRVMKRIGDTCMSVCELISLWLYNLRA